MNINQLENFYKVNGLTGFKLRNTVDLLRVHGIDFKAVDGYEQLDDLNRAIYEKFILNIFNAWGLDSRTSLIPKGIYWVEDSDYLIKENPKNDYFTVVGGIVYSVDGEGNKALLHKWEDEDYKYLERTIEKSKAYLRFEYEHQGRSEWLHVIKEGKEWY